MIYAVCIILLLSLIFNYFSIKLIGEQSLKLDKKEFELFSLRVQMDLERSKNSEQEAELKTLERTLQ
jgi:hypothetical protein